MRPGTSAANGGLVLAPIALMALTPRITSLRSVASSAMAAPTSVRVLQASRATVQLPLFGRVVARR